MRNQVKLAGAGFALLFLLVPGALAMQGCAAQASSATAVVASGASALAAFEAGDATYYADAPLVGQVADDGMSADLDSEVVVSAAARRSYSDGVYTATSEGKCGQVPVTVTIAGGRISRISVGDNFEAPAMAQEAQNVVVSQIISTQSVDDIDTATGATYTSEAIISATAAALERAAQ